MTRISPSLLTALGCAVLVACGGRSQSAEPQPAPAEAEDNAAQEPPAPSEPAAQAQPAPAQAAATLTRAELGKPAPDFTLTDTDGKSHTLAELRGKTVVLEWFNADCPFIRYAHTQGDLKDMAKRKASADLVWLGIVSSASGKQGHGVPRNVRAKQEYGIPHPLLLDETGVVGRAYGAEKTPHMYVIDPKGVLVYRGGIDNAPMGEVDDARPKPEGAAKGQRVNYVDAALEDLAAGRPVRLADTPAYGCSVKYSS